MTLISCADEAYEMRAFLQQLKKNLSLHLLILLYCNELFGLIRFERLSSFLRKVFIWLIFVTNLYKHECVINVKQTKYAWRHLWISTNLFFFAAPLRSLKIFGGTLIWLKMKNKICGIINVVKHQFNISNSKFGGTPDTSLRHLSVPRQPGWESL